jgi:hypothetical protein
MHISSLSSTSAWDAYRAAGAPGAQALGARELDREKFDTFVGEAFFGQMLKAMRTSVGKSAYFHGGRAEEIFQGQLDQILSQEMTEASASELTGPMFELFQLTRS